MKSQILFILVALCIFTYINASSRHKLRKSKHHKTRTHGKEGCPKQLSTVPISMIDAGSSGTRVLLFVETWQDPNTDENCNIVLKQVCKQAPGSKKEYNENQLYAQHSGQFQESTGWKLGDVFVAAHGIENEGQIQQAHTAAATKFLLGLQLILKDMFEDGADRCVDNEVKDLDITNVKIILASTAGSRKNMITEKKAADLLQTYFKPLIAAGKLSFNNKDGTAVSVQFSYDVVSGRFEGLFGWLSMYIRMEQQKDQNDAQYNWRNICKNQVAKNDGKDWQRCLRSAVYFEQGGASSQISFPIMNDCESKKVEIADQYQDEAELNHENRKTQVDPEVDLQKDEKEVQPAKKSNGQRYMRKANNSRKSKLRQMRKVKKSKRSHKKSKKSRKGIMYFDETLSAENLIDDNVGKFLSSNADQKYLKLFSKSWLGNGSNELEAAMSSDNDLKVKCFNPENDNVAGYKQKYKDCVGDLTLGNLKGNPETPANEDLTGDPIQKQYTFVEKHLECAKMEENDLSVLVINSKAAYFRVKNNKKATKLSGILTEDEMTSSLFTNWPTEKNLMIPFAEFKTRAEVVCGIPYMEKQESGEPKKNDYTVAACLCAAFPEVIATQLGFDLSNVVVMQDDWAPGAVRYNQVQSFDADYIHSATAFQPTDTNEQEDALFKSSVLKSAHLQAQQQAQQASNDSEAEVVEENETPKKKSEKRRKRHSKHRRH